MIRLSKWQFTTMDSPEVEVQYDDVMNSEQGLAEWTKKIVSRLHSL